MSISRLYNGSYNGVNRLQPQHITHITHVTHLAHVGAYDACNVQVRPYGVCVSRAYVIYIRYIRYISYIKGLRGISGLYRALYGRDIRNNKTISLWRAYVSGN